MRTAFFRRSRRLLPLLLLAVALAQTLGAMHRIVHAPKAALDEARTASAKPHAFAALFAGHASEQGCELFDQLSHGDVLQGTVPPPAEVPGALAVEPWRAVSHPVPRAAGFLARGPPRTA